MSDLLDPPAPSTNAPRPVAPVVSPRRIVRRGAVTVLAFLVGFVLFLTVGSAHLHDRSQAALLDQLRSDLLNGLAPVNGPIAPGTPIALLEIPAIGVQEVVVEGTGPAELTDGPGHLAGSSLPGQPGVSAVLGRRLAYGGPFEHLDRLVPGDDVEVTTGQGVHRYEVLDVTARPGADAAAFIGEGNMLLLVTGDGSVVPDARLVVRATLETDVQAPGLPTRVGPATVDDLGLEGDGSAGSELLAWLQLLAIAGILGVLFVRRFGWRTAWVMAAPPVVVLSVLVWEQLVLLLPALT